MLSQIMPTIQIPNYRLTRFSSSGWRTILLTTSHTAAAVGEGELGVWVLVGVASQIRQRLVMRRGTPLSGFFKTMPTATDSV